MFAWEKVANFTMKKVSILEKFCIKIQKNNLQRKNISIPIFKKIPVIKICPKIKNVYMTM